MRKLIHNITVTVFEQDEETIENHKQIFQDLLPVDFKKEKVNSSIETVEGFNHKTIYILRLKTEKKRHNETLLNTIFTNLSEKDKKRISEQMLTRINHEGYFFIRLKKDKMLANKFELTEGGDCYHFKIKLAGFPAKWQNFVKSAKSILIKNKCPI